MSVITSASVSSCRTSRSRLEPRATRGLSYLCRAGVAPDERVAEAIDLVVSKRDGDGRWPVETTYPGRMPVETGEGRPSRWNTLRALRVLRWHEQAGS